MVRSVISNKLQQAMSQTTTQTKSCAACANWKSTAQDQGECRSHAPQLITFEVDASMKVESRFPTTSATDWCGEFEAK